MLATNLLNRRINYRNFKQDDYPTKEKIEEIVQEAINVAPMRGEIKKLSIDILGPEHSQLKKDYAYTTICEFEHKISGRKQAGTFTTDEDWIADVKKIYETEPELFNNQVKAPYLMVIYCDYVHKDDRDWDHFDYHQMYMNTGILLYALGLAANRNEVDTAYCKCYNKTYSGEENIILKYEEKDQRVLALVCMGYYDFDEKSLFTRDGDWIEHDEGGRYNIITRERDGYKTTKPSLDQIINWK